MDLLEVDLNEVMRRDRFRLRRWHQRLKPSQQKSSQQSEFVTAYQASKALRAERREALTRLKLDLNDTLPVSEQGDEVLALLRQHQVMILAGETRFR